MHKRHTCSSTSCVRVLLMTIAVLSSLAGTGIWQARRQAQKDKMLQAAIEASDVEGVRAALRTGANPNAHLVYTNSVRNLTDACLWLCHDRHIFWHDAPCIVELGENGGHNDPAILLELLQAGADINSRSNQGQTALMNAAEGGRSQLVSSLLQHGADPNLANKAGATAKSVASDCGYKQIVAMLSKAGAK